MNDKESKRYNGTHALLECFWVGLPVGKLLTLHYKNRAISICGMKYYDFVK